MIFADDATLNTFVNAALKSVKSLTESNQKSLKDTWIGLLYGDTSPYSKLTPQEKQAYLRKHGKPGTQLPNPVETSCVGYVWRHVQEGYRAIGREDRIAEIRTILKQHASDGNYLLLELHKDGFETVYWNPDVNKPSDGDSEHPSTYQEAKNGKYYVVPIQHFLINYRRTRPLNPKFPEDKSALRKLENTPLWFGTGWGAYHCFMGYGGEITESHTRRNPEDPTNIEVSRFETWGIVPGSGRDYLSGCLVVPPRLW